MIVPLRIPAFENIPAVDKEGNFTDQYRQILTQLFNVISSNLSADEGIKIPNLTADQIQDLEDNNITPFGTLVYDSTNDRAKINIAGIFEFIDTTP